MRLALLAILAIMPAFDGYMKVWQIEELMKAPVLAVCRVERITEGPEVPPGTLRWRTPTRHMTATLTVLRSLPVIEATTIVLDFYAYTGRYRAESPTATPSGPPYLPELFESSP